MTADTTSDEEVPETPPSQSPPTPNLYLFHKSPTQDENQSAPDQCEDAEDAEIDDDFQGPAGEAESEIVPEDDVPDVPLNTDEDKRQEVLRKIAAVYWREITAITSLKPVFTFVYYSLNHDYDKTGSHKTRVKGYKRHLISTWNQVEKVQKAYCNMILAWASQKAHLERRFVGLRRTGYLNKHDVPQDKIQLVGDDH
ncbi:unnamed protein product [Rhizoctonia solani]|uniref:Uncharacterized protein n=1 Tax=Rhizoctonia solani TaxID=456999 RepID=A0A8H3C4D2_9AGAM|nr:unnamed protein product [Rhizoctonia solani]